ncbi:hypothetical protein KW795_02090 [Candidatus Microgenomates bacterium]|nr:hypothetical protein [Candidatus Microgenomates bacterium]
MANPIFKQVKVDTKKLAQTIAKQLADEPGEILKTAVSQTTGVEQTKNQENSNQPQNQQETNQQQKTVDEQKLHNQSMRMREALETELKQIQDMEEQKELESKNAEIIQNPQEQKSAVVTAPGKTKRNLFNFGKKRKGPRGPTGTTKAEVRKSVQ